MAMPVGANGVLIAAVTLPRWFGCGGMGVAIWTSIGLRCVMAGLWNAGRSIDRAADQQQRGKQHHAKARQGKDRLESHCHAA